MNWKKIGFHANVPLENSVFVFVSYSYEKIFSLFWEHDRMVYFFIHMKIPRFIVFNGFISWGIFSVVKARFRIERYFDLQEVNDGLLLSQMEKVKWWMSKQWLFLC